MASYSNTSYTNDFFSLQGVYFNSSNQSSSSLDLAELDKRYLQITGGIVSSNLVVSGSLDIQNNLTLPTILDVESTINGKQSSINDNNLSISNTSGLQSALNGIQPSLSFTDNLVSNSIVVKPQTTKFSYTPAVDGEIRATTLTIDNYLTGEIIDVQDAIANKQEKITEGTNISIVDNQISCVLSDGNDIKIVDGVLTLSIDPNKRITINGLTSSFVTTGTVSCDNISTTFDGSIGQNLTVGGYITAPNHPIFKTKCNDTTISGINTNLNYNGVVIDTYSAYDTVNGYYVVPVAGNWFFYCSFQSNSTTFTVQIEQNSICRDLCQISNMNPVLSDPAQGPIVFDTVSAKGSVILPCVVGDIIRVRVVSGSARLGKVAEFSSFGGFLIG